MIRAVLIAALLAGPAAAQDSPAEAAERAAGALQTAALLLDAAEGAKDRVAALTETVRAYEAGLAALRDGIRRTSARERAIRARFEESETRVSALLGALMSMRTSPETVTLLHPSGPANAARADMILADVTPELAERAAVLKAELEELQLMRTLQDNAEITLRKGLSGVQAARTALSQAISERTAPPDPDTTDMAAMAALVAGADTLDSFAASLAGLPPAAGGRDTFSALKGELPLPVSGTKVTGFNEPGADGVARPGLRLATEPRALVTAPHAASIRYAGPLLDLGQVAILEPEPGTLLVLSGMAEVFGAQGDIIDAGAPVGLMGGEMPGPDQILIETGAGTGQDRPETLYMELRQGQGPVDPGNWFAPTAETGR